MMRRRATNIILGLLLFGGIRASTLQSQTPTVSRAQAAVIDSVIGFEMRLRRIPGAAVAVVDRGQVVFKRAYGIANLETGTPLEPDAVFELASVTKQFTAAAIMLLVEEGKVRLDEPISTYIDKTPPEWARITVRHLLTHTSGLDASGVVRYQGSALLNITTRHAFEFVSQPPLRFQPGQEGWYNDAGYFLLGMIIEKAAGQSYREFMQRRVFDSLQLSGTSILNRARVLNKRVPTYMIQGGELLNWRRDWDYEVPSFFGIFSTLDDLARWDAALRGTRFLQPASLAQMWTPAKLDNGQYARVLSRLYGFGFELSDLRGRRTVGHGGASGTYLMRFLDEPLSIIVLTNLESSARHPLLLARSVAGALRPEYRPPNLLSAQPDPTPEITRAVQALLTSLTTNQDSPVMSEAYRGWLATAPGFRAVLRNQLAGLGSLVYLGRDDIAGSVQWEAEPIARLVHYKADVGARTFYFTIGLTRDGKVGRLEFQPYQ